MSRNLERFPEDFMFQLTAEEQKRLIFQTGISKKGRGGLRFLRRAFTEQGVAMLSSVLRSETAVRVNIEIMRAFVRMRRARKGDRDLFDDLRVMFERPLGAVKRLSVTMRG